MGWGFPWGSSPGSDFHYYFQAAVTKEQWQPPYPGRTAVRAMRSAVRLLLGKIDINMLGLRYQVRQPEEAPDGYPGRTGRRPGTGSPG